MNSSNKHKGGKKVLVITYYWPPSGGSPVLRWLKFIKYLNEFGWEATVYTPENPEPQAIDEMLINEVPESVQVIKRKIKEPYGLFKRLMGKPKGKSLATAFISDTDKTSFLSNLLVWIRGNLFIPDARRFWIKPSVRFLTNYLTNNPHDVVVSTGPPHSMHLIAMGLKFKTGIPWLADFRDPWTNIDYYSQLKLSKLADRKHHRLEAKVLRNADEIITVSPTMTTEFSGITPKPVITISNGFDDIPVQDPVEGSGNTYTILHVGSLPESRNPALLWKVLGKLFKEDPDFRQMLKIKLIGNIDISVLQSIDQYGLLKSLDKQDHISNTEVIRQMTQSSILLLVINQTPNATGILTNKFFEYLAAERPILGIGPVHGDAAVILDDTSAGKMIDYNDENGIEKYILTTFADYRKGVLSVNVNNTDKYRRRNLTKKLAQTLDSLGS